MDGARLRPTYRLRVVANSIRKPLSERKERRGRSLTAENRTAAIERGAIGRQSGKAARDETRTKNARQRQGRRERLIRLKRTPHRQRANAFIPRRGVGFLFFGKRSGDRTGQRGPRQLKGCRGCPRPLESQK
jgi:hypothetical protein